MSTTIGSTPAAATANGTTSPSSADTSAAATSLSSTDAATTSTATSTTVHPLQHKWTYWYNPPNKADPSGEWKSNTRPILSFDTVEDFWRLFNVLKQPTSLTVGSGYHLFKHGISPEWEDEENKNGGKWMITFQKREGGAAKADEAWLYTLLALIGEQFEESEEITGAVIAPRQREYRVALWTHTSDPTVTKRIGQLWKNLLAHHDKIGYSLHNDAIEKGTSYNNPKSYMI